jgi:hypothetical protein
LLVLFSHAGLVHTRAATYSTGGLNDVPRGIGRRRDRARQAGSPSASDGGRQPQGAALPTWLTLLRA